MAPYSKQRQSHRLTRVETRDTSVSKLKTNHIDNYATKSMQKLFLKNSLTIPKKNTLLYVEWTKIIFFSLTGFPSSQVMCSLIRPVM